MVQVLVLDSTAFYAGIPYSGTLSYYTTPLVVDEVSHGRIIATTIEGLIDSGRLVVMKSSCRSLERVKEVANRTGDKGRVSETDLSVIALGLDLKDRGYDVMIVSDDYSVENLAKLLDMPVAPVMSRGITKTVHWIIYCRGCGKVFRDSKMVECDVCGTRLKWKFKKGRTLLESTFKSQEVERSV